MQWCENISDEEDVFMEDKDSYLYQMINLFYQINAIIKTEDGHAGGISDNIFCTRVYENMFHNYEK